MDAVEDEQEPQLAPIGLKKSLKASILCGDDGLQTSMRLETSA